MVPISERRPGLIFLVPVLVAAVLALPCLGFGYFWDDYVFLSRARHGLIAALGPEPGAFYRPIPRALYFWPLAGLGSSGAIVAHLANLVLAAASIYLLVTLVRDLAGPRAGLLSGLAFAGLGTLPGLIGWASGSQDLLAMVFTLLALRFRRSGKLGASAVALAAGLLSKETAICALPALVFWDWIVGKKPARIRAAAGTLGAVALAWGLLHPGIRGLGARGFALEARGYVGFANLAVSGFHARRYLDALANVPADPTAPVVWTGASLAMLVAAMALTLGGIALSWRNEPTTLSLPRAAILGITIALPALALPALMIQRYAAYFVCMPFQGVAILLGVLLARMPKALAMTVLAAYVGLGFWSRQADTPGADALTERSFADASRAIREVERGFRALRPGFPHEARVLVSVAASGPLGIDGTLHDGQALETFYRDPTIRTLRPERRLPRPRAEFLYRVTGARDVVEIDADEGTFRSSGAPADSQEIRAVTRTYARGLAATGEAERAARILARLASSDPPDVRSYDLRLAAMGFLAEGDSAGAARLLDQAPPISQDLALEGVARVMSEPTGHAAADSAAYAAFGISPRDVGAMRRLMQTFYGSLFVPQAVRFARIVQNLAPGDSESAAILRELR